MRSPVEVWAETRGSSPLSGEAQDFAPPVQRAMHEAVFEAGWDTEGLMPRHRAAVAQEHRGGAGR